MHTCLLNITIYKCVTMFAAVVLSIMKAWWKIPSRHFWTMNHRPPQMTIYSMAVFMGEPRKQRFWRFLCWWFMTWYAEIVAWWDMDKCHSFHLLLYGMFPPSIYVEGDVLPQNFLLIKEVWLVGEVSCDDMCWPDLVQEMSWSKIAGHDCAVAPDTSIVVNSEDNFHFNVHWSTSLALLGECIGTWHFSVTHIRTRTAHQEEALELLVVGLGTFQFNHSVSIGKSLDTYLPMIFIHSQGMKGQPRWKVWTLLGQGVQSMSADVLSRCQLLSQQAAGIPRRELCPFYLRSLCPKNHIVIQI